PNPPPLLRKEQISVQLAAGCCCCPQNLPLAWPQPSSTYGDNPPPDLSVCCCAAGQTPPLPLRRRGTERDIPAGGCRRTAPARVPRPPDARVRPCPTAHSADPT